MKERRLLILGLGNPLRGDDGVGNAILERLRESPLPSWVDLIDGGTSGFEIVLLMQEYNHVIILDAANMGLKPGDWRSFTTSEVKLQAKNLQIRGTLHYAGLPEALSLGSALNILPEFIVVIAIQPATVDWSIGLSNPIEQAIPDVTAFIYEKISTL